MSHLRASCPQTPHLPVPEKFPSPHLSQYWEEQKILRAQAETGKAVWGPQSHLGEEGAQTHLALARQGPDGHC